MENILKYWRESVGRIVRSPRVSKPYQYRYGTKWEGDFYKATLNDYFIHNHWPAFVTCGCDYWIHSNFSWDYKKRHGSDGKSLIGYQGTMWKSEWDHFNGLVTDECYHEIKEMDKLKAANRYYPLLANSPLWRYGNTFVAMPYLDEDVQDISFIEDGDVKAAIDLYVKAMEEKEFIHQGSDKGLHPEFNMAEWLPFEAVKCGVFLVNINPKSPFYKKVATSLFPADSQDVIEFSKMFVIEKEREYYFESHGCKYADIDYYYSLHNNKILKENISKIKYQGYDEANLLLCWRDKIKLSTGVIGSRFLMEANLSNLGYIDDLYDDFVRNKKEVKQSDPFLGVLY